MARIAESLRQQVAERARGRCEYCLTQQEIVVSMQIDHIIPLSAGGDTTLENLCLSCISCNGSKYRFQMGMDPDTRMKILLFHPRTQVWAEHFAWREDGARIVGLTDVGRATVARLRMNREKLVESRRRWIAAGWHPPLK